MRKIFIIIMILLAASLCAGSPRKDLPPVGQIVYSCGKDDNSWMDMGPFYTSKGEAVLGQKDEFPAAIYAGAAPYFVKKVTLTFQCSRSSTLIIVLDLTGCSGSEDPQIREVKLEFNGKEIASFDIPRKLEDKKEVLLAAELPAVKGENKLVVDMSHNQRWFNIWLDRVIIYEPGGDEE